MNTSDLSRSGPSRRAFLGSLASASSVLGATLLRPTSIHADANTDKGAAEPALLNPIPGGVAPFAPFGVFIHHNGVKPSIPLANINDPSGATDFDGFVGACLIRGGGTGTNTTTGASMPLAFQASMGFNQGKFIGTDGRQHEGSFAFV